MEDDDGDISDTPMFKLQASSNQSDRTSSSDSSPSSSSTTPDSSPSSRFDSNSPSSGDDNDGARSRGDKDGKDEEAPKATGRVRPSETYTPNASVSNNTPLPTATGSTTLSLLPSATNRALVAATDNNKPSTVAIVVPLAIFAAALAGLIFSLRQRSKTRREIEHPNGKPQGDPSLNRTVSKESSSAASESSAGSAGKTDLERAMEFISGVQVPKSPNLTPLPPSIDSKRRARMQNKLKQDDVSQADRAVGAGIQTSEAHTPRAAGRPVEASYSGSYHGPGFSYGSALDQLPALPRATPLVDPSTYAALASSSGFRPETSQVMAGVPPGLELRRNMLGAESRPPTVFQPQDQGSLSYPIEQHFQLPAPTVVVANQEAQTYMHSNASQPVGVAPPSPAPIVASVQVHTPAVLDTVSLPPPPTLPASLRVAQPQTPSPFQHDAGGELHAAVAQLRPHESAPLPAGPGIPYATRPSTSGATTSSTLTSLPNPYAAIATALRSASG
ncbi:hypothetical protein FRC08_014442 [Ceratobasidium sp. 394]|nr:hypothetical protein FRC08_014442 [Ceratobasidium sp. 394]KAG9085275.1 hypothetical protein FS749_004571 [Ceratobasidium sp. UAMH 11750]